MLQYISVGCRLFQHDSVYFSMLQCISVLPCI